MAVWERRENEFPTQSTISFYKSRLSQFTDKGVLVRTFLVYRQYTPKEHCVPELIPISVVEPKLLLGKVDSRWHHHQAKIQAHLFWILSIWASTNPLHPTKREFHP